MQAEKPSPISIDRQLLPNPRAPRLARAAIAHLADELPAPLFADLRLLVSELVTRCVLAGSDEPIGLRLELEPDGAISGEVDAPGDQTVGLRPSGDPDAVKVSDLILDAIADDWGVATAGERIWFELRPSAG